MLKRVNTVIHNYAKRIIFCVCAVTACCHAYFSFGVNPMGNQEYGYLQLVNLIIELISIVIITIWFYVWKRFRDRLIGIGNSFKNDVQFKTIFSKYKKRFNREKLGAKYWIYIVVWLICTIFIVLFSCYYVLQVNILSIWSMILFVITMLLNNISYYDCVEYVQMLYELSEINPRKIIHLTHNRFQPSASWGLQRLVSNTKLFSDVFLLVSLLYTIESSIVVVYGYFHGAIKIGMESYPFLFLIYILLVFLTGIGTFIAIIVIPYYCIKRIFEKWKERSLLDFEKEMIQTEKRINNNKDLEIEEKQALLIKRDKYVNYINALTKDKFPLNINLFQIVISLSTIFANIVTILAFILLKN